MTDTSLLTTTQLLIRIRAYQHRCWKQGNPISIDSLLQTHPALGQDADSLIELIYGEFSVRESLGEQPTCEQYCRRYPQLSERLERLIEVHHALDSGFPSFSSIQQTIQVSDDCSVVISPKNTTTISQPTAGERTKLKDSTTTLGRFGDYQLLEEIDRGGMGVVYRARQIQANRIVALKMILAGKFATRKELKRFYSEAEAAARLDHPNIVPIYEINEHDGHPFFTMAYVDGPNLASRIMQGPLAQREAAVLIREIAEAIEYAHQHGIIHRDLKPANILLTTSGQTRITDFGLAKRIGAASELTVTGDLVGTPSYMSPEQVNGNPDAVDIYSDIYSLGAILYCLLTGRPPFQAATVLETFTQLTQVEPVPPRQFVPTVSADLETICLKCLQKAPSKRYLSATELISDLNRYLAGKPVLARPIGQLERVWRWCQRKPIIASLSAAIGLLVLMIAVVSSMAAVHHRNMANKANQARHFANAQAEAALKHMHAADHEKKTAQHNLYAAHMSLAQMAWHHAHVENVINLLDRHTGNGEQLDLRRFEWHYLYRLCHQDLATVKPDFGVNSLVYAPDGRQLLLGTDRGQLVYWNLLEQRKTFSVTLHRGQINQISLSPNDQHVATVGNDGTIVIWDLDKKDKLCQLNGHANKILSVCFNHDGTQLATGNANGSVRIWNVSSGQCVRTLTGHKHGVISTCFNADGTQLATGSRDTTGRLWDLSSSQTHQVIRHRDSVDSVQFSPLNDLLATGSGDGTIQLWSTVQSRHYKTINTKQWAIRHLQFSPDGTQLASAGANNTIKLWNVSRAAEIRSYKGHYRPVRCLAFHPDGRRFVSASWDLTIKEWNVDPSTPILDAHQHIVQDVDYSPDGKWLATASFDQTIKLWQVEDQRLQHIFSDGQSPIRSVRFSPDGKWLAAGTRGGMLYLWDLEKKRLQIKRLAHQQPVNQVAFTYDSQWIGSVSDDGTVKLWNLTDDQPIAILDQDQGAIKTIAFSPDGSRFVTGGTDQLLRIWDRESQQMVQEITGHQGSILTAAWSPDGRWIASSGQDRSIRVWDVKLKQPRSSLKGHTGSVTQVRFSPCSQRIVSASYDRSLKLWDTNCGNQILTLRGHRGVSWCAQFSPNGNWIASGSSDSTVRLWDGRPVNRKSRQNSLQVHASEQ